MRRLPAEFENIRAIQITWPDPSTDWKDSLEEIVPFYVKLTKILAQHTRLYIVGRDLSNIRDMTLHKDITLIQSPINDTWARDHGFITVFDDSQITMLDYQFNGWGLKFASNYDNQINKRIFPHLYKVTYENHLSTVLEGGSIDTDGQGTILTTSSCLLSPNRNGAHTKEQIEEFLRNDLGAKRILWLKHGHLIGDDTDSHIDTLARFAPNNTIFYVKCYDPNDPHYEDLNLMEKDLKKFRTADDEPYNLIPLPLPSPVYNLEERLPVTYANFLYLNNLLFVPTYDVPEDEQAIEIFKKHLPNYEIIPINCLPLVLQHGSLHCATMQYY